MFLQRILLLAMLIFAHLGIEKQSKILYLKPLQSPDRINLPTLHPISGLSAADIIRALWFNPNWVLSEKTKEDIQSASQIAIKQQQLLDELNSRQSVLQTELTRIKNDRQ